MKRLIIIPLILAGFIANAQQKYTVSGYIRDAGNGENLIGATILQKGTTIGTTSNTFGFYSISFSRADTVQLIFSYVGYEPISKNLMLDGDKQLNISLAAGQTLEEVVVTAEEKIEQLPQMSAIDLPIDQVKALPVLMGEADVLKTIQLLPGIQSGSEGMSGVYVRGGGPDQNLILLDGVPVYNASHLFGFFSVFNPDAINRVNVIKGGFPARYGGRLSSVIDISMKEGNNKEFAGEGSIGLISSKLTLEGPVGKSGKTSYIISGRRTYIDLLARPLIKASSDGQNTAGYYFYDVNAKINHRFSDKDRLYLSVYNGNDTGYGRSEYTFEQPGIIDESKDQFGLGWGNTIVALRWNHIFSPRLFANFSATYSKYKFRLFSDFQSTTRYLNSNEVNTYKESIEYISGVEDFAAKVDFDFIPSSNHTLKFGLSATDHTFRPGVLGFDSNDADTVISSFNTRATELFAYVEDDIVINENLRTNIGGHYSSFIVDNTVYHSFQPRVSLRYLVNRETSLKASYAQMTQFIHLLTNSGIGLPTDLWVPTTDRVRPQQSWQVALGGARTLSGYEISIEAYYKKMANLIEYREGASFFNQGTDWQEKVTSGSGESYGAEFLIQKKIGKLSGWIGYTLSWTYRKFDELNFGKRFPYKYDRRHDISVVGVYEFSKRFTMSGTWVFGTGNAITIPLGSYQNFRTEQMGYFADRIYTYSERNAYRMRNYHRLDLGFTWTKEKKWGTRSWSVGTYNTYSRRNPFYIDQGYNYETDSDEFIQYSLFPLIPYFRYSFKF